MRSFGILLFVMGLAGMGACSRSTPTAAVAVDPDDALFDYLYPAKEQMKTLLKDTDSARYENVNAYKTVLDNRTIYAFCGEVNAKNGFGAYGGYERFLATSVLAEDESEYSDFDSVWNVMCANRIRSVVF